MAVGNGVHLHHLILEIFVQNLKDQKIDFTGTILHNNANAAERKKPRPLICDVKCILIIVK